MGCNWSCRNRLDGGTGPVPRPAGAWGQQRRENAIKRKEKCQPEPTSPLKRVEQALLENALCTRETTLTWERKRDPESGDEDMILTKKVEKQSTGSVTAQKLYLTCRAPTRWGDTGAGGEETATGGVVILPEILPEPEAPSNG